MSDSEAPEVPPVQGAGPEEEGIHEGQPEEPEQPHAGQPEEPQEPQYVQQPHQRAFALSPALAYNEYIDLKTYTGMKLFRAAIQPLEYKFDCRSGDLKVFLAQVEQRVDLQGWSTITEIPPDLTKPDDTIDLVSSYGRITLQQVRDHAAQYVRNECRAAQDSRHMFECLWSSLTKEGIAKLGIYQHKFTVHGRKSGACLLKVIITESYVDTNATTKRIRISLTKLDEYMASCKSNVEHFNKYVEDLLDSLAARGETTQDLLPNLVKGYQAASDKTFVKYMAKSQAKTGQKTKTTDKTPKDNSKKGDKGKSKTRALSKPAWMYEPPESNESTTKVVKGKTYHWCKTHKAWGRHDNCKGLGYIPTKRDLEEMKSKSKGPEKKKLKLRIDKAYANAAESTEESDPKG